MEHKLTQFNHLPAGLARPISQGTKRGMGRKLSYLLAIIISCMSMNAQAQYCNNPSYYTADEDVFSVTIGSMTNASSCGTLAGGVGSAVSTYSNYVGTAVSIPTLQANTTYTVSVTDGTCNGNYPGYSYLWIDYNGDGDWFDAGELVWTSPYHTSTATYSGTFTTPSSYTYSGLTRARVIYAENGVADPCTQYYYGETEDYSVIVGNPCTGAPSAGTAVVSPTNANCQGAPTLGRTGGASALNLQFQWQTRPSGTTTWTNLGTVQTSIAYAAPSVSVNTDYRFWVKCPASNLTDTSAAATFTINNTAITPTTTTSLCTPPGNQTLTLTTPVLPDTIFKEKFNGTTNSMTTTFGGGFGWTTYASGYYWSYAGYTINTPDGTPFMGQYNNYSYISTPNVMTTPSFSTVGYTAATLSFQHWFFYQSYASTIEISTNGGTSWTNLATYSSSQGSSTSFASVSISLNAYLNQSNVKIRFSGIPYYYSFWAMDNIVVKGTSATPTYSWTASPPLGSGLPAGAGTPSATNTSIVVSPTATGPITYTGTVTGSITGCTTIKAVVVNVNPKPSASLSLSAYDICNGGTSNLGINFTTGTPPYTLTYTDGVTTTSATINTTSTNIPKSPNTTRVYKILTLSDPNCTASSVQIPDTVQLVVHPRPTAALNNQSYQICDGTTAYLSVTLTGTPPFDMTYYDGTAYNTVTGIMVNNYQLPIATLIGTHTYSITALNDLNCAAISTDMTGTNTIAGYVRPTATISGNPTICNGSFGNLQVNLTGAPPYNFTYGDGGSFTYTVSNIMSSPYTLTVTPSSNTVYTLTGVHDQNCASIAPDMTGASNVTVKSRPTGSLAGSAQTVCHGNPVTLTANFTGTPPFSMMYTNGSGSMLISPINTNSYTFTTTPQTSGSYMISALTDASCVSMSSDLSGTTPVTVNHPAAALSGSQISCSGGTTNLLVDFSGNGATPPYTFTYTDGQQTNTVTTTSDPYALTVNTTGSSTFVLTNFNDANCMGDISGTAAIVANPNGGWNGNTSSDWQNPANWCGGVPSSTTDVIIPAIAPNMPVLSTGVGYTHNLTIDAGASMSITNGANYYLFGDLDNNGTLNWNTGNVSLNGTAQTVDGFACQSLIVNSTVTPTQDITVNGVMQLNGNVYLYNTDLIMPNSGSQIIGQQDDQYVHTMGTGTLKRSVTTMATLFPVGKGTYAPVNLTNNGVPDEYAVRVFDAVYADGDGSTSTALVGFPVVNHTWMISEKNAGGSSVTVAPIWYNHPGEELNFFDRAHVFVRHWDGSSWSYVDSLNAGPCVGYGTFGPYSASQAGYNTFSPFTVGAWNLWPLAIELVDFTAQLQDNNNALVSWNVSQSSDAKGFDVEYSTDGANFSKVGEVSAVANKTNYSMMHRGLAEGRNYYRLKVMDVAGKSAYSKIAVVTTKGLGVDIISLSPNPVTGVGTLSVSSDEATSAEVRVMDAVGRVLSTSTYSLSQGSNNLTLDMNNLPQGNYTLHVITSNGNATPVKFTKL